MIENMEKLNRAVEKAREKVVDEMITYATTRIGTGADYFHDALDDLEAAVEERARAEERELIFGAPGTERVRRLLENAEPGRLNGPAGNY